MFNRKQLLRMSCTGLFWFAVGIYYAFFTAESTRHTNTSIMLILYCIFALIAIVRWSFKFSACFPNASFFESRIPWFRKGQPDINTLSFNYYKWLLIAIIYFWIDAINSLNIARL